MYFPSINKLLFEPEFMKYISEANAWHMYEADPTRADTIEYNDQNSIDESDNTFDISLEEWYKQTNENKRFKEIAIKKLHTYIADDWTVFNEKMQKLALDNPTQFNTAFETLKNEYSYLKNRIIKKEYFKPVATELFSEFDKVIDHYNDIIDTPITTTINNTTVIDDKIYFLEINKLLSEREFRKFLSIYNHDYLLERNHGEWLSKQEWDVQLGTPAKSAFDIPFEDWYKMSVKDKSLFGYIVDGGISKIARDWNAFNADMDNLKINDPKKYHENIEAIKKEINSLKENIARTSYLKPISKELFKEFDEVIAFYGGTPEIVTTNKTLNEMDNSPKNEPLQWNGGVSSLATLFHDLRTTKGGAKSKVYLDYTPKELQDFILKNFVDEEGNPFSENSVKTYLDPKRPDKKAKNPIDIPNSEKE